MPNSAIFFHIEYPNLGKPNFERFFPQQNIRIFRLSQYLNLELSQNILFCSVQPNEFKVCSLPVSSQKGSAIEMQKWKSGEVRHATLCNPTTFLPHFHVEQIFGRPATPDFLRIFGQTPYTCLSSICISAS